MEGGLLPAIKNLNVQSEAGLAIRNSVNQTTSTILLTLAKLLQDYLSNSTNRSGTMVFDIPTAPSQALLLPMYYLAISLHPSASTANNLGILLSTLPQSTPSKPLPLTGQVLAQGKYLSCLYVRLTMTNDLLTEFYKFGKLRCDLLYFLIEQ
jgi:hypothetical protein